MDRFRKENIVVLFLFIVYFINGIIAIPQLSITYDEGDNLSYGIRMLKGQPRKVKIHDDASTMPMLAFNALPRAVQQVVNPDLRKNDGGIADIIAGRYITLFITALTGLFIFKWSRELYGAAAGVFSLFLFVFCPNLNANTILVTTDATAALFTISTAFFFCRLVRRNTLKNLLLFTASIALAQLTKQSLTHLFIIFPLIAIVLLVKKRESVFLVKKNTGRLLVAGLFFLFIINAGFLFSGSGQPLSRYHFESTLFKNLQSSFSFLGSVPLPFPEPYVSGLDLTKNLDDMGAGRTETSGAIYILGESRIQTGFWYYYFVSFFFKTPIPVIACLIIFLVFFFRQRQARRFEEYVLLCCIFYFLFYFSFLVNSQVGLRHVIIIFPLLYVLLGRSVKWLIGKRGLAVILATYSVITFYFFFPNLFAYSNEFLPDKKKVYWVLGNANIDYGQGYYLITRYMKNHPAVTFAPLQPQAGKFVISAEYYLDAYNTGRYKWLHGFEPIDHVQYNFLLFDISENDLKHYKK